MEDDTTITIDGRVLHHRRRKTKGVDSISSLPDVILQHIISFLPTKLAIRTSLLSKRWRHVWCDIPSIYFDDLTLEVDSLNRTLTRITAPKIMKFYMRTEVNGQNIFHMDKLIEFAMSRNVENLSLESLFNNYRLPDLFYNNSTLKKLSLRMVNFDMVPSCCVSWTSLKKLSLGGGCIFSEGSIDKILSGCSLLESLTLTLGFCNKVKILDLSKSLHLRVLEVEGGWDSGVMQIVAPHIHCLMLKISHIPCTLVDVSSLTEATLDINCTYLGTSQATDFLLCRVLKILEKVHNLEKLTLGGNFLQILSLAEIRGLPFPILKVKALNLKTSISRYVIPSIERVLQNSPDIKKLTLTLHFWHCDHELVWYLDRYLELLNLIPDQCWRSKKGVRWNEHHWEVESRHVSSFMELMLNKTETLEKMVVQLAEEYYEFKEQVLKLAHHNNVSIVVSKYEWSRQS